MNHEEIKINALKFSNGDIIVATNQDRNGRAYAFFVKTSDGVMQYNAAEMVEIYGFDPNA